MNSFRYWYLKHFNPDKALEELRAPAEGEYIIIRDGPVSSVRIRVDRLDEYVRYMKEKSEYCSRAYEEYLKNRPLRSSDVEV